eukprot:564662-Rhodomonas_salina.1
MDDDVDDDGDNNNNTSNDNDDADDAAGQIYGERAAARNERPRLRHVGHLRAVSCTSPLGPPGGFHGRVCAGDRRNPWA